MGKTTLARFLLRSRAQVWVIDVNDALDWHQPSSAYPNGEYLVVSSVKELLKKQDYPRIIFKPPEERMEDFEEFNYFFKAAYLRKNVTVYVDEAYAVTNEQIIPQYMKAILTRGRGRGVELFTSTQRPSRIPTFLLSETNWFYIFRVQHNSDAKRIEESLGVDKDIVRSLPDYVFYASAGQTKYPNLKLGLNSQAE